MRIPQRCTPPGSTSPSTEDPSDLATARPERLREYVQVLPGEFRGSLRERRYGSVGVAEETWSCGLRVRSAGPRSYVAFVSVIPEAPVTWCGVPLDADAVIHADRAWEVTSLGPLRYFSITVEMKRLERTEDILTNGDPRPRPVGNSVLRGPTVAAAGRALRRYVAEALDARDLPQEARRTLEEDLIHLAANLRSWGGPRAKPEAASRRRAAVRRVEQYLAAKPDATPSLAELCEVAEVSERTLEYAFRELIGTPPARYLRIRRLNAVRRELLRAEPTLRVTEAAIRCGFWELGRFASEYRALFGERPSQTLAARRRRA